MTAEIFLNTQTVGQNVYELLNYYELLTVTLLSLNIKWGTHKYLLFSWNCFASKPLIGGKENCHDYLLSFQFILKEDFSILKKNRRRVWNKKSAARGSRTRSFEYLNHTIHTMLFIGVYMTNIPSIVEIYYSWMVEV